MKLENIYSTLALNTQTFSNVYQMYYKTAGREGIASSLTAIQVTDFKEYTGSVEFEPIVDIHGPSQETTTTPQAEIAF